MAIPLPIIDPHFHVRWGWFADFLVTTLRIKSINEQVWDVNVHPNATLGELGERLPTYSLLDYERDTGVGVAGYVVGARHV